MEWHVKLHYAAVLLVLAAFFEKTTSVPSCANGSSFVADCLHTYLERDFPSIEAIVFPRKQSQTDNVLLLDGPELEDQCHRIGEVVECLEDLQADCYYYDEFFPFRHLVASLRKSINWVCTPEHLRSRFRTLLNAFNCLETARQRASSHQGQPCFHPNIPTNIWQRIVRLQSGTEVCKALAGHMNCTQSYTANCPTDAQIVYKELNQLFLNAWCTPSQIVANCCKAVESPFPSSILSLITALALVRVHGYFV